VSYVVFGRNTARTGPFPASLDLADLLIGAYGAGPNGISSGAS
jgi:hypothetical protein